MLEIVVEKSNICDFEADAVVLKHAQSFYGADGEVASALGGLVDPRSISPSPGNHVIIRGNSRLAAPLYIFIGVTPLNRLSYGQLRAFSRRALEIVAEKLPNASHIAMTMHGAGYGLDEREAFLSLIGGIFESTTITGILRRVTIVEIQDARAKRLKAILREILQKPSDILRSRESADVPRIDAGIDSERKKHVFVAMPFSKEYEDTYYFGIQSPVHAAGLLCERVDMTAFTGDILQRITNRIETSELVIADLTGANANVYLEVGYAWGKGRPTLLVARSTDDLKFDVQGQRCIKYDSIFDLAGKLSADLKALIQ